MDTRDLKRAIRHRLRSLLLFALLTGAFAAVILGVILWLAGLILPFGPADSMKLGLAAVGFILFAALIFTLRGLKPLCERAGDMDFHSLGDAINKLIEDLETPLNFHRRRAEGLVVVWHIVLWTPHLVYCSVLSLFRVIIILTAPLAKIQLLLDLLRCSGPMAEKELAKASGMSKLRVVNLLLALDIVRDNGGGKVVLSIDWKNFMDGGEEP